MDTGAARREPPSPGAASTRITAVSVVVYGRRHCCGSPAGRASHLCIAASASRRSSPRRPSRHGERAAWPVSPALGCIEGRSPAPPSLALGCWAAWTARGTKLGEQYGWRTMMKTLIVALCCVVLLGGGAIAHGPGVG